MDPYINLTEGQRDPETSWTPIYKFEGGSVMGPYIHLTGDAKTSLTRKSICTKVRETAKPHGPVDTFEGGPRRPRNLMDP